MTVLFLQQQPCIRSLKYAEGLRSIKDDIKIIFAYLNKTLTQFYGYGDELFDRMIKLGKKKLTPQIRKLIYTENIDIVHSHNAPDFLTLSAIEASRRKIPIIHDIHDLISIRSTSYGSLDPKDYHVLETERRAITECNGLIFVTSSIKNICESAYSIDQKPTLIFPNYIPRRLIPSTLRRKLSEKYGEIHIVYAGSLDSVNLGGHYDLKDIFKAIADQGINIHIYSSKVNPEYEAFADSSNYIHYHGHLEIKKLLQEITQYDYGWAGFNTVRNKEHVDTVLANKVMEYISCGLPVISFGHKTQKKFIDENGIGIVINEIGELSSRLNKEPEINEIRSRVLERRHYFTIEDKIRQVLDFYKSLTSPYNFP